MKRYVLVLALMPLFAAAETTKTSDDPVFDNRLTFSGSLVRGSASTKLRLDATDGTRGSDLDGETDLGLSGHNWLGRGEATLRPRPRHRVRLTHHFLKLDRRGSTTLARDNVFGDETILAVGTTAELKAAYPNEPTLDASGCVLMPGFVDPHTHLIWAGDRANEFELKMSGMPYLDILAAGGGILSTVKQTRAASMETLITQSRSRLLRMFVHGTTTAEAKTGYGLQTATELRLLKALLALDLILH